jgi:transcriptional regulator with XRE-family HTH domain
MPTGGQSGVAEFDGRRLRTAREQAGLSRAVLAARTGVAEETLRLYEVGQQEPRPQRVALLARRLGVSPAALLVPPEADSPDTLRQLRINAGLRQFDVTAKTAIGRTTYAALERGEVASISDEDCAALAKAFKVGARVVRAAQSQSRAAYLARLAEG